MMEQAITIKKLDGYDQLYSMADSEIRRVIGTNEDIESAMENLNDELNILLEKQQEVKFLLFFLFDSQKNDICHLKVVTYGN